MKIFGSLVPVGFERAAAKRKVSQARLFLRSSLGVGGRNSGVVERKLVSFHRLSSLDEGALQSRSH